MEIHSYVLYVAGLGQAELEVRNIAHWQLSIYLESYIATWHILDEFILPVLVEEAINWGVHERVLKEIDLLTNNVFLLE